MQQLGLLKYDFNRTYCTPSLEPKGVGRSSLCLSTGCFTLEDAPHLHFNVSINTQKIQEQWLGCELRLLSRLKEGLKIGSTAKSLKSKSA